MVVALRLSPFVRSTLLVSGVLCAAFLGGPAPGLSADTLSFGPYDVRSVFHVAKSENKNEVHYAVRVDADCRPRGATPVFGYWRRLKKGVWFDEPLLGAGVRVYGASAEQSVSSGSTGGSVGTYVRALEELPIDVRVEKTDEGCRSVAWVTLKGERARLSHAFLQLGRFGLSVKFVDVFGFRERDGTRISEQFD